MRVDNYERRGRPVNFYMTPKSIEAMNAVTKGNRSWYLRQLFLLLNEDKKLRDAIEPKLYEVNYD